MRREYLRDRQECEAGDSQGKNKKAKTCHHDEMPPPPRQQTIQAAFSHMDDKLCDQAFAEFFISSGIPFRVIEDVRFRNLLTLYKKTKQAYPEQCNT